MQRRRLTAALLLSAIGAALFAVLFFMTPGVLQAQEEEPTPEEQEQQKAELERELQELEREIARIRDNVQQRQAEAQSLERDVAILNNEIRSIELQIRAAEIAIQQADADLRATRNRITEIGEAIERQRKQIAAILREVNANDSTTLLEMLLKDETLSDFFMAVDSLQVLQGALQGSLEEVRVLREELKEREVHLEETIEEQQQLLAVQESQRQTIAAKRSERQRLLDETRGEEELFQQILTRTQRDANAIRNQLFILEGGGSGPLTFEQAYEFAKQASELTGIRVAFLMSVIKQESNFGSNVGQCFWRQAVGGRPVMHPTRDQPAFAEITAELGINPDEQPVSCPGNRNGQRYGWGGAMGFAQFLPSTWMGYKEAVGELTGRIPPSPWRAGDAFTASAVKLMQGGAGGGERGEFLAAMRYFSGGSWAAWEESVYARPILQRAAEIERQIAILEQQ